MKAEDRAEVAWHEGGREAITAAIKTAEAEAYRRGQEAFRVRVLELNMYSYDHEMIRKLPIEEEEVADGR